MSWIEIINDDLPRLRLYAAATLGSAVEGDAKVEAALRALLDTSEFTTPDRVVLFRLLDWQARDIAVHSASDRVELLKHVCGFSPEAAAAIVGWTGPGATADPAPKNSAPDRRTLSAK